MSLNENDLYEELGNIYQTVGAQLGRGIPYYFYYKNADNTSNLNSVMKDFRNKGLRDYARYMETKGLLPESTPWERNSNRLSSIQEYTGIAWGQSQLKASPLNMARIAGIVGNDGIYIPTRFTLSDPIGKGIRVLNSSNNQLLSHAMNLESKRRKFNMAETDKMGGKTGTPNRVLQIGKRKISVNDGWYICYFRNTNNGHPLAVALRLERLITSTGGKANSGAAINFMKNVVIPTIEKEDYLK